MKIPISLADKLPTAQTGMTKSGGMGKTSPMNIPLMDDTAKAISAAGRVASDIAQRMYVAEGQRETLEAYNAANDGFNNTIQELKKPEYQDMNVEEHQKWFADKANKLKGNVLGGMKNFKAKQAFTQKLDMMVSDTAIKAQAIGWDREVDKGRTTLYNSLDKYENEAGTDPMKAVTDATAAINGSVAAGYINSEQGTKIIDEFNNRATMTFWKRQSDDFQEATFDTMFVRSKTKKGFPVRGKDGLYVVKEKLPESFKNFDEEQKRQTLEYIKKGWEDYWSRWSDGLEQSKLRVKDNMRGDLARIKDVGVGYNDIRDQIRTAWADKPKVMAQVLEIHKKDQVRASASYYVNSAIYKAGPKEEAEIFNNLESGNIKDDPYFKELTPDRLLEVRADAYTTRYKKQQALSKDPYSYVLTVYPELQEMSTEERTRSAIIKQRKFGVPEVNVKVMPVAGAKLMVEEFNQATGAEIVGMVDTMKQEYGPYFGNAMKELQAEKLPEEIQVIASLNPIADAPLRQRIAEASKLKEEKLKERLGDDANAIVKDINIRLNKKMSMFDNAVLRGNNSAARIEQLNRIRTALRKSIMLQVGNGVHWKDAVDGAVASFVDNKYQEVNIAGDTTYIPAGINATPRQVSMALSNVVKTIESRDLVITPNPNIDEDVNKKRAVTAIRNKGYWALNRTMTGMILYSPTNGLPVMERVDGKDQYVEVLFERAAETATPKYDSNMDLTDAYRKAYGRQ